MYSPTDFTEFTELLAEIVLPQISQNSQNFLLRLFSHRYHRFTELLAGIVLPQISRIYTELLAECILPQISQNSQNFLLKLFSHRFHRSTQIVWVRRFSHRFHRSTQIVWVPSRGCTCLKCTNVTRGISILLGWCTSCSGKRQSRAETSAPPEVGRFCEFCAICGSHFAVEGVSKLASVTPRRGRST